MDIVIPKITPEYIYQTDNEQNKNNIINQAKKDNKEVCYVGYGIGDTDSTYIPSPVKEPDYYMKYKESDNYDYLRDYRLIWGYGIGISEVEVIINLNTGEHLAEGTEECDNYVAEEGVDTKRGIWLQFTGSNNINITDIPSVELPDYIISIKNLTNILSTNITINQFTTSSIINMDNAFSNKVVTFNDFTFDMSNVKSMNNTFNSSTIYSNSDNIQFTNVSENIIANKCFYNADVENANIDSLYTNYIGGTSMFEDCRYGVKDYSNTKFKLYSRMFYDTVGNEVNKSNYSWISDTIIKDVIRENFINIGNIDFSNCTSIVRFIYDKSSTKEKINLDITSIQQDCEVTYLLQGNNWDISVISPPYNIQKYSFEEKDDVLATRFNSIPIYYIDDSKITFENKVYGINENAIINNSTRNYAGYIHGKNNQIYGELNGICLLNINGLNSNSSVIINSYISDDIYNACIDTNYISNLSSRYIAPAIEFENVSEEIFNNCITINTNYCCVRINDKISDNFDINLNIDNKFIISECRYSTNNTLINYNIHYNNNIDITGIGYVLGIINFNEDEYIVNGIFRKCAVNINAKNLIGNFYYNNYVIHDSTIINSKELNIYGCVDLSIYACKKIIFNDYSESDYNYSYDYIRFKNDIEIEEIISRQKITYNNNEYSVLKNDIAGLLVDGTNTLIDFFEVKKEDGAEIDFYNNRSLYNNIPRSKINKFASFGYSSVKGYVEPQIENFTYIDDVKNDDDKILTNDLNYTLSYNIMSDLHDWIFNLNPSGEQHTGSTLTYENVYIPKLICVPGRGFDLTIDKCSNETIDVTYNTRADYNEEFLMRNVDDHPYIKNINIHSIRNGIVRIHTIKTNKNSTITNINIEGKCKILELNYVTELTDESINNIINAVSNSRGDHLTINEIIYAKLTQEQISQVTSYGVNIISIKNEA